MRNEEWEEPVLTRRMALKGGSAAAVAVGASMYSDALIQAAKAQTTEPRIQLGADYTIDDDGSDLVISHDTNGDILKYDAGTDKITTLKTVQALTADDLQIQNQSYIQWQKDTDQAYSAANNWETITFDTEDFDVRNEGDLANDQFSVDNTGSYKLTYYTSFDSGSDQDEVGIRMYNATDGNAVAGTFNYDNKSGSNRLTIGRSFNFKLDSTKTYEIQARNFGSDDNISAGETVLIIEENFRD